MSMPWVSLVAMTFAVTTMVVGLSMFFLVLWQAPTRRGNQLTALYMLEVVCWAAMSLLLRLSGMIGGDAHPFFYGIVLGIGFNGLFLYAMVSNYAGLWKNRWVPLLAAAGFLYYLLSLPALFAGNLYTGFSITPIGEVKFVFTPMGYVSFGIAYAYYILSVIILWRYRKSTSRGLLVGAIFVTVGVLASIHPFLSQYSIPIMTAGITTIFFAHAILMENLFNPLALLNQDLTEANKQLSHVTTELRDANQRLSEANRLKSSFLASMSHELRTPLNSILGYSDMLLQGAYGPLNETQLDRIATVVRNGRHLLQLISDILDLSKIEAGQMQLKVHPLDLSTVFDECFTLFAPLAEKKGLVLRRSIAPSLRPVLGDRGRVLQVLVNLVGNAIKFTATGGVEVRASNEREGGPHAQGLETPGHGWVLIMVEDTGVGIRPEDQQFIFEEFRQVDETMTREYEGTGLGLAISRLLVGMMDGRIWVESELGKGSRFCILLPASGEVPQQVADIPVSLPQETAE